MNIIRVNTIQHTGSLQETKRESPRQRIIVRGASEGLKNRFPEGFLAILKTRVGNFNQPLPKDIIKRSIEPICDKPPSLVKPPEEMMVKITPGVIPPPPPFSGLDNFVLQRKATPMYAAQSDENIHHIKKSKDELVAITTRNCEESVQLLLKNSGNLMAEVQEKIAIKRIKNLLSSGKEDLNNKLASGEMTGQMFKTTLLNEIDQVADLQFCDDIADDALMTIPLDRVFNITLNTGNSIKVKFEMNNLAEIQLKKL